MVMLINELKEMELDDNALLIFMNSNGTAAGYKPDKNIGETAGFNARMRGAKGIPYEGGLKVPFFIR